VRCAPFGRSAREDRGLLGTRALSRDPQAGPDGEPVARPLVSSVIPARVFLEARL
jgi:hypothetical protein